MGNKFLLLILCITTRKEAAFGREVTEDSDLYILSHIQPDDYRYMLPRKFAPSFIHAGSINLVPRPPGAVLPAYCPSFGVCPTMPDPNFILQVNQLLDEMKFSSCFNDDWRSAAYLRETKTFYDKIDRYKIGRIIGPCSKLMRQDSVRDIDDTFRSISDRIRDELAKIASKEEFLATALHFRNHPNMYSDIFLHALHFALKGKDFQFDSFEDFPVSKRLQDAVRAWVQQPGNYDSGTCFDATDYVKGVSSTDENNLAYFREDLQLNQHHAAWHAIYATEAKGDCMTRTTSNGTCFEDKRGELFTFMHRQLLARYDTERITHCLKPVAPFELKFGGNVDTSYDPNMLEVNLKDPWRPRRSNSRLPESLTEYTEDKYGRCVITTLSLNTTLHHINNVKKLVNISNHISHDVMGNIIEASSKSTNPLQYGNIHNDGHRFIARSTESYRTKNSYGGVMESFFTAMRDPIFYRWHAFVDQLLDKHKATLPHYDSIKGLYPLRFNALTITDLNVNPDGFGQNPNTKNELFTFFINRQFRFPKTKFEHTCSVFGRSDGYSEPNVDVNLCLRHLHHFDFKYEIELSNDNTRGDWTANVRMFLAPLEDENGVPLTLKEQRPYIMMMDIFNVNFFEGERSKTITQKSNWSKMVKGSRLAGRSCGLPKHLLLPKGSPEGKKFKLIAFITDPKKYPTRYGYDANGDNNDPFYSFGSILCGHHGGSSPETILPMGYPFDRDSFFYTHSSGGIREIKSLEEFKTMGGLRNMFIQTITITHFPVLRGLQNSSTQLTYKKLKHNASCTNPSQTPRTPTPLVLDCFYDQYWTRHCHPPPSGYSCHLDTTWGKICRPQQSRTPPPTLPPCFYDHQWVRHCHPPPPGSTCGMAYGHFSCSVPTTEPTTTTQTPQGDCYYDQYYVRHCQPPPAGLRCNLDVYRNKMCYPVG